jgi:hypothetical protein
MIIVLRFTQDNALVNRLKSLGLIVRDVVDAEGNKRSAEQWIEDCTTPILTDTQGKKYISILMSQSQANKLPPDNNPAFSLLWREDDLTYEVNDGEGETYMTQYPWPEVEVNTYDEDGNINGTVLQGVGRII